MPCVYVYYFKAKYYVSPHEMGIHIVFSSVVCPSVHQSVSPSHFRVRSISFEPLVGFTNNFAQMSSMMRRCAYVWSRSGQRHNLRFNIVWLYFVSALYLLIPWWDTNNFAQMSSKIRRCAVSMFEGRFTVKVTI